MKILLNALGRTRSKWVATNLHSYLKTFGETHNLWPTLDLFTQHLNGGLYIQNQIDFDGSILTISNKPAQEKTLESMARLNYARQSNLNMCIKIHPTCDREIAMVNEVKKFCQYYFTLARKDIFEQALSLSLGYSTNIWVPGVEQIKAISSLKSKPVTIQIDSFQNVVENLQRQTEYLTNEKSNKFIYMEDTFTVRDSKDFCDMLNLEHKEFMLDQRYGKEYGEFKKEIISNYNELETKYNNMIGGRGDA